ncbi:MAG TPA: phosphate acetyltransferase [Vicinamibacteria bacterium]|jgi:phosphate acetyltransferase
MAFMESVRRRVRGNNRRVVFPEGLEERAVRAAGILRDEDLLRPVLLAPRKDLEARAAALGVSLDGIETRDPRGDPKIQDYAAAYHDLRRHKGVTAEEAASRARLPHYFGALMVNAGDVHGMVSGLNSETKPFLPAFEIVRMLEGMKRASSVFVMDWPDRTLFYADCSVNIAPDAPTLAEIGRATAATVRAFGIEPRVAFLSFSTRDSAKDASVDRVKEAVALVRRADPGLTVDGEIQFDAAFVPAVARKKAGDSPFVEREANVFVFPDLNAGNIAYKITERLSGAAAIGPILQGLRKPVNDVSRGCSVQDFADVAVITAALAGT